MTMPSHSANTYRIQFVTWYLNSAVVAHCCFLQESQKQPQLDE